MNAPKALLKVARNAARHWVGDGFPVRTIFGPSPEMSPFLMLDYGGPAEFPPTDKPRGVDEHPHRGFETVTVVYQGGIEHRDSAGNHGVIGPGDVQWMTAASGVVHEEKHSAEFSRNGGLFQMAQLWVNLPADLKMSAPKYQSLHNSRIPVVDLHDSAGQARIVAGNFEGVAGAASTFTPIDLWDLRLHRGKDVVLPVPSGHTAALFVVQGRVHVGNGESAGEAELALFDRVGDSIELRVEEDSIALLLGGAPIHEPIVSHGPFVMNSQKEIAQAIADYRDGKMGHLP